MSPVFNIFPDLLHKVHCFLAYNCAVRYVGTDVLPGGGGVVSVASVSFALTKRQRKSHLSRLVSLQEHYFSLLFFR